MSVNLLTPEEFEGELLRRECEKLDSVTDEYGTYWHRPTDGAVFQVPHPEEESDGEPRYPEYILHRLIASGGKGIHCLI